MAIRTTWQDKYAIEQTSSLTATPTFASTAIGIEGTGSSGGKFLMPLTDHPHLPPASATQENELAVGVSQRHNLEYNQTIAEPSTVTINMLANAYNVSLFLWLLFQTGATESSGSVNTLQCIPYTSAEIEIYTAITRLLGGTAGDDDTVSQYMPGCVCRSVTISGETGGIVTLAAEMVGANWATANDDLGSVSYSTLTFSDKAPLKFQDMVFQIGANAVNIPSFSITFNNNVAAQFYNNDTIQNYILGRLNCEGSFGVPWSDTNEGENQQLTDFQNGSEDVITAYWGNSSGATDNSLAFVCNVRRTETGMEDSEGEIVSAIDYSAVEGTSNEAINIYAGYSNTYLLRGVS